MSDELHALISPDLLMPEDDLEAQGKLITVSVRTTMGAHYVFPDMLVDHIQETLLALNTQSDKVMLRNISGCMLIMPARIIESFHRVSKAPAEDKIHESAPQYGLSLLWSKP